MNNTEAPCLLCGSPAQLIHSEYPGYQEPDTFRIYHCTNCNTAFSLPKVVTSAIYENIYKNAVRVPGYNRYWRYSRFIKKFPNPFEFLTESAEAYWGVKEALSLTSDTEKKLKILEVGSGLGYLTYSLVKANYDVVGLDISQTAVTRAKEMFGDHYICSDLFEFAGTNTGSFDIVVLTEVIEHVENPLDFITSIIKLLKPGGRAIITTPNKSFFPEDIIWATDLPPVHCWWFSEESIRYMASGLKVDLSFINFNNYYKKNYKAVGLKPLHNGHLPRPFFNKDGELIAQAAKSKSDAKLKLQVFLARIPFGILITGVFPKYLKMIFGKSRKLFERDLIVCKDRGIILCAVMQKRS